MSRALAVLLTSMLLSAAAPQQAPAPATPQPRPQPPASPEATPEAPSPWLYNTRSRTDSGITLQEQGELAEAVRAFDTALGLAPDDPLMQYNAGTAGLAAAVPQAIELLAAAADSAPDALRPAAFYNLGTAQMEAEDFPAAIESYKEALRLSPDNGDAKHNLELAMRKLQEQQQQQQQQQQDEQDQEQEEDQRQQHQEQQQQPDTQEDQPQDQEQPQDQSDSPLPDFDEQPDMTAEQAAAILEAVENLEREQRRKQALEQLKRAKGDRDW